jgi:DNA-binding response OmpR family regulator
MKDKILVIDDDPHIRSLLKMYLSKEGYEVVTADGGGDGIDKFKNYKPDLIILDIIMPKKDGLAVCREIREISSVPIIILTAKKEEFDTVLGLETGADDFMAKPFGTKEVVARIRAVLRRTKVVPDEIIGKGDITKYDNLEISMQKFELKLNDKAVAVPPKELEILYFLMTNVNHVFTRDQLLDKVWGYDYIGDSRTVDVHIKRLRDKLDGVSKEWNLKTIWGIGYKFETVRQEER